MTIPDPKYRIGAIVYHVTSDSPGVVVRYIIEETALFFGVSFNGIEGEFRACELTTQKPNWDLGGIPAEAGD